MDNYLKNAALEYNRLSKEAPAVDFAASESVGIGVLCALSATLSATKIVHYADRIATSLERIAVAQERMAGRLQEMTSVEEFAEMLDKSIDKAIEKG